MLGLGSPAKQRWTRRSLRQPRSPVSSTHSQLHAKSYAQIRACQEEEAEKLLRDTEDELRLRLETLSHRQRLV